MTLVRDMVGHNADMVATMQERNTSSSVAGP